MQNITSNKTHLARGIATLMTVLFALWFFPAAARADNWQGVGTQGKPYLINSAADLETLSQKVAEVDNFSRGMYFQLGADIVLDKNWKPIGVNGGSANRAFQGTLDGKNHQITFAHGSPPLFGAVYADGNTGAVIKNLKIYGKYIAGNGLIEGFIRGNVDSPVIIDSVTLKSGTTVKKSGFLGENGGYVLTVEIKNCVAEKNVKIGWDAVKNAPTDHSADYIRGGSGVGAGVGSFVSGLCGTVANSKSAAMVYGQSNVGGIAGYKAQSIRDCSVISCQFSGEIVATGKNVGGILGAGSGEGLTGFWA
ncbi:MAG: hypothetical protein FWG82_06200, partial [Oscillospiraceae bacterium]|nr:hypothetical protein [Oscillospiraceae bacterium]